MLFKVVHNGRTRRLHWPGIDAPRLSEFQAFVRQSFELGENPVHFSYDDDEQERISMANEEDFLDSLRVFHDMHAIPKYYVNENGGSDSRESTSAIHESLKILGRFFKVNNVDLGALVNDFRDIMRQTSKRSDATKIADHFAKNIRSLAARSHAHQPEGISPSRSMSSPSQKSPKSEIHSGVVCDGCNSEPIIGTRFKCGHCNNFDYCNTCFTTLPHNSDHSFQVIQTPQRVGFLKELFSFTKDQFVPETLSRRPQPTPSSTEHMQFVRQPFYTRDATSSHHPNRGEVKGSVTETHEQTSNPFRRTREKKNAKYQCRCPKPDSHGPQEITHLESCPLNSGNLVVDSSCNTVTAETIVSTAFVATWQLINPCSHEVSDLNVRCVHGFICNPNQDIEHSIEPKIVPKGATFNLTIPLKAPPKCGEYASAFVCTYQTSEIVVERLMLVLRVKEEGGAPKPTTPSLVETDVPEPGRKQTRETNTDITGAVVSFAEMDAYSKALKTPAESQHSASFQSALKHTTTKEAKPSQTQAPSVVIDLSLLESDAPFDAYPSMTEIPSSPSRTEPVRLSPDSVQQLQNLLREPIENWTMVESDSD